MIVAWALVVRIFGTTNIARSLDTRYWLPHRGGFNGNCSIVRLDQRTETRRRGELSRVVARRFRFFLLVFVLKDIAAEFLFGALESAMIVIERRAGLVNAIAPRPSLA